MLKAIKDELYHGWQSLAMMAGVGWGVGLLLDLIVTLVWYNDPTEEWAGVGSIVALVAALFMVWIIAMVQFSSAFALAVTMGRTRRRYMVSSLCANLLLALASMAAIYPLVWVEEAIRRGLFAALPLEGGTLLSAYPVHWMFTAHLWMVPLLAVSAVLLGTLMGALFWRLGRTGFWILWGVGMLGGALASRMASAKSGWLSALRHTLGQSIVGLSPSAWVGIWVLACLLLGTVSWLLVRRAAVK